MNNRDFEKNFRRLYLPLGMYALRLCGNTAQAEELVQEAFLKLWAKIEEGLEIDDFKAYAYGAVRNEALHWLRDCGRREEAVDNLPELSDEQIDTSERDAALWRAIEALPERCRRVFLLSKRDGLSHAEIADEMGISVKTVENQITKAYSRLRGELTGFRMPVVFLPFL